MEQSFGRPCRQATVGPSGTYELTSVHFPFGAHDDCCDALGLAGQLLDKHVKARKPLPDPDEKPFDDYRTKTDVPSDTSFMTI